MATAVSHARSATPIIRSFRFRDRSSSVRSPTRISGSSLSRISLPKLPVATTPVHPTTTALIQDATAAEKSVSEDDSVSGSTRDRCTKRAARTNRDARTVASCPPIPKWYTYRPKAAARTRPPQDREGVPQVHRVRTPDRDEGPDREEKGQPHHFFEVGQRHVGDHHHGDLALQHDLDPTCSSNSISVRTKTRKQR